LETLSELRRALPVLVIRWKS